MEYTSSLGFELMYKEASGQEANGYFIPRDNVSLFRFLAANPAPGE